MKDRATGGGRSTGWDRERLLAQLVRDEGLRLKPYRCTSGRLTIGVGRNLDDAGITEAEAHLLLHNDLTACAQSLDAALPWWREMNAVRQEVLLNMRFNMGLGARRPPRGLLSFVHTLRAMREGRYRAAAAGMLASRWARQVKGRAVRLARAMERGAWT